MNLNEEEALPTATSSLSSTLLQNPDWDAWELFSL
jgi:hypothetical protein